MSECVYEVKSITSQIMRVYEDRIELTQEGVLGFLAHGASGTKTYYFTDITTIQFKNCGWTAGFFEFTFAGGVDGRGGAISGTNNDNRFEFGKPTIGAARRLAEEMEPINNYLQERLRAVKSNKNATVIQQASAADELKKFKELLDMGILTQEEFDAKKKELLGL